MVCHAAEYAFGERSHVGRAATRPAEELVGAGAPTDVDSGGPRPPARAISDPHREDWAGRAAVALFVLGLLGHVGHPKCRR
jgi:hypothetical protein